MQWQLQNNQNHWIHEVRPDREQPANYLTSLSNNVKRKPLSFADLEENGTEIGTYAYNHVHNSYTPEDIDAKSRNESYAKRQRRG